MNLKGREMLSYLPEIYDRSRIMQAILNSQGGEIEKLLQAIDEILDQYFALSASWWLDHWEFELGIETDPSKPIEQRRSVVISKIRGTGTVTVAMIKRVAESYVNGEVDVSVDSPGFTVIVTFISNLGVPENIWDIENAIRDVIPAHLAIRYEYRYLLVQHIHQSMTVSQLQSTKLNKFSPFREVL